MKLEISKNIDIIYHNEALGGKNEDSLRLNFILTMEISENPIKLASSFVKMEPRQT